MSRSSSSLSRHALSTVAVLVVAAALTACSGSDGDSASTATTEPDGTETSAPTEVLDLANDTGRGLTVPADARAVWVTTTDRQGEGPGAKRWEGPE